MPFQSSARRGLWLPLVTPFRDGMLDESSVRRLIRHYAPGPVQGLILAATTGEALTLSDEELERLVTVAADERSDCSWRVPLYLGLCSSDTRHLVATLERTVSWPVDGYMIACPYYSRPSQQGLLLHFSAAADATTRPILIYNIPYRTGVNLGNETLLRLAERSNIVGVKDCSADPVQSFELLRIRPPGFSVLTGEDTLFYTALTQGADGGILASGHCAPQAFAAIQTLLDEGRMSDALVAWHGLVGLPRLLFSEPSPAPIKHWLWRAGLITSPEVRLPMTSVTPALATRLDHARADRR